MEPGGERQIGVSTRIRTGPTRYAWAPVVFVLTLAVSGVMSGQDRETYTHGQTVAPAFEGWEKNPDGTFNMVFGYFNRNYQEQVDAPVGPDNTIEPGGPDQGQPTRFFPRRNKFMFRVKVPKDFGNKDLVWTLTTKGKTEKAYGTLKPDYLIEPSILMINSSMNLGIKELHTNKPPVVKLDGETHRRVRVGEPLTLNAVVTDDGLLKPRAATQNTSDISSVGLRVAWFVWRGAGNVAFEPEQFKIYADKRPIIGNSPWTPGWAPPPLPPDGKYSAKVTFGAPGTYVIRIMAHDGGLQDTQDVTVNVERSPAASR